MSITEKLAQAPEWMRDRSKVEELATHLESIGWRPDSMGDAECCDQAAAMSADVLREVLLPMIDASQSTPAGEVTADAVVAQNAYCVFANLHPRLRDGYLHDYDIDIPAMQAALAAAYPALVKQVERLTALKFSLVQDLAQMELARNEAIAERDTLSEDNAELRGRLRAWETNHANRA